MYKRHLPPIKQWKQQKVKKETQKLWSKYYVYNDCISLLQVLAPFEIRETWLYIIYKQLHATKHYLQNMPIWQMIVIA